jgi:hypothetical protein
MLRCIKTYFSAAAIAGAALFGLSPALAQNPPASLFICAVTASDGGCANGSSSPAGLVTFTFSNFVDSFVNGLPGDIANRGFRNGKRPSGPRSGQNPILIFVAGDGVGHHSADDFL